MRLALSLVFQRTRGLAAVLLAFVLVLRIVAAPFVMAAPSPGVMAICTGGKIVYISLDDGQPIEGEDHPASEACPFFGIVSVLPGGDAPKPDLISTIAAIDPQPLAQIALRAALNPYYQTRAPPHSL